MEYKEETRKVEGNWPLEHYSWKFESIALIANAREAFKEKRLLGLKCPGCGLVYFPPKPYCRCMSEPDEWVEVQQQGTVTTYTFTGAWAYGGIKEEGGPEGEPLIIVGVNFDGSDTLTVCTLSEAEPEEVFVGMRVQLKWPENIEGRLDDIAHVVPLKE